MRRGRTRAKGVLGGSVSPATPFPLTRAELVRGVCRRLNFRDPKGDWRVGTTMKALRTLESQGWWTVPKATPRSPRKRKWNPARLHTPVPAAVGVPAWAEEVRGLQLVEVTSAEEGQLWNELVIREHPLRQCRLVGRQLRYLVGLDHGWLGAIGFGSAALYLAGRDAWLGWTADQRMEHLPRVLQIQMNRFFDPSGRPV
ncbi:MAG: Druantia anti-phage system protein DruA [Verrucomicrobiota bacterium]